MLGRWRLAGKNVVDPCPDLRYEGAETMAMKRVPRVRDLDAMFCEDLLEGLFCGLFEFGGPCLVTFQFVSLRLGRLELPGSTSRRIFLLAKVPTARRTSASVVRTPYIFRY